MEGQALRAVRDEVEDLSSGGPSQEELDRVREQAKANVLMGLESVQARMSHLGASVLLYGGVREADEILAEYDKITREQVRALAQEVFQFPQVSLSAVGRVASAEEYAERLNLER